jgi:hypothetical protein
MNRARTALRAGDVVEVKSPQEIARTLDEDGALDGLPFMPEMLPFCGQVLRVTRRAEKTCVEYPGGDYRMREFRHNDVVLLDVSRCSGADHDGCQRACMLFWKTAWLRRVRKSEGREESRGDAPGPNALYLKTKSGDGAARYFCQSTQLDKATLPLSTAQVLRKCVSDLRSGSRGFLETVRLVFIPIWRRIVVEKVQRPLAVGTLTRTPVVTLGLRPGEIVRIKAEAEILKTLDSLARNRGLSCDRGMRQFCGGEYPVRNRLDRMISEATGEMRKVESTVMLEGLTCLCWWNHLGGCPREDFMYWREAWLERAPSEQGARI